MSIQLQMAPVSWQIVSLSILGLALLVATAFDATTRRIPNVLSLVVVAFGVILHAIGPNSNAAHGGLFTLDPGILGGFGSILGACVALMFFLPFHALGAIGAGDVKLLSGVGAFAGTAAFFNIALWVLVAGGVLALARVAIMGHPSLLLSNMVGVLTGRFKPAQTLWRMPYAVAIAAGVAAHAAWVFSGRTPILNF